jgi:magnesium-transporting ATPase (P-type)
MGRGGTDVAREAADMVLTDDNFVSIYAAVEEGRITFDNIRKATFFLISSGAAEVVTIVGAVALGWPLVLLPAQILWLNLVTDSLVQAANARSVIRPLLGLDPRSNPYLLLAVAATLAVHATALYLPPTRFVLRVEPIGAAD